MGNLRPVLLIGLAFLGYMIWVQWQKDYAPAPAPRTQAQRSEPQDIVPPVPGAATTQANSAADLPQPVEAPQNQAVAGNLAGTETTGAERSVISVLTDVLDVEIDLVGGTVVSARLLDYPVKQKEPANQSGSPCGPGGSPVYRPIRLAVSPGRAQPHQSLPGFKDPFRAIERRNGAEGSIDLDIGNRRTGHENLRVQAG